MRRRSKIALISAGALAMVVFVALSASKSRQGSVEVRLEKVGKRDLVATVSASGRIQPMKSVDVSSDITGRIVELPIHEGDYVRRGQLLLRIDPAQYQALLERAQAFLAAAEASAAQARANRDQAERGYERARTIRAENPQLVSQEALEQAQTQRAVAIAVLESAQHQVEQARAALREAQDQLRKTTILAPMSGRITRLAVEEGEVAVPGTFSREVGLLLTISDLSVIEARVLVDETDVVRLHLGDSVEVSIDAFPDTTFMGRVTKIRDSAIRSAGASALGSTEQAVDFEVVVTLANPPPDIRPDLSATARIVTDVRPQVLSIPIIALTVREHERLSSESAPADTLSGRASGRRRNRETEGVFVVDRQKVVSFRPVKVGIAGEEYFEVQEGVREGETIVAGPYQTIRDLRDGRRVRPTREPRRGRGAGRDTVAAGGDTARSR